MAKFVMECPNCGKYVEAKSGFFAKKKVDCACGHTIDIRAEKLTSRTCPHCGNNVVYDQTKGKNAKCPVCGEHINTLEDQNNNVEIHCAQCGIKLIAPKNQEKHECPVCGHVNNIAVQMKMAEIKKEGLASIIKYEGDADTLVWKHPIEDFNYGSQLIVHESQEAIFFRDGQALDSFGSGRYTLETQQLPLLEKLYKLPTDPEGTFHSEVYFFNLTHQMAIKWGTPEKVNFIEPMTRAPISMGARGVLNLRVVNARKLMLKLVGTGKKLTRQDLIGDNGGHIKDYFRSVIQMNVTTNLAKVITDEKIDILQVDQQKVQLSAAMMAAMQNSFVEYGLEITDFLIQGVTLPEKGERGYETLQQILMLRQKDLTKSVIEAETELGVAEAAKTGEVDLTRKKYEVQAERLDLQLEMDRKAQIAQIEAEEMRLKGYNQKDVIQSDVQKAYAGALGQMGANGGGGGGSMLGEMAGLGVAIGAMGGVIGMTKDAMTPMMNTGTQAVTPAATGWNCTCGTQNIISDFCPNCGSKKPTLQSGWNCTCGQQNIASNFCPNCGAKKPEPVVGWDCECGEKNIISNFCPNCGAKKPEPVVGWDCQCGEKNITGNFCSNCGAKKPEPVVGWDCQCGEKNITGNFCSNCGHKKDEE